MKEDELLKDVFRRAARGEPAVGDAFGRFERHERRAALTRFFTIAAVALVSAVLLTRLLPGVSTGEEREGYIPAGQDLSEPSSSNLYRDAFAGFQVNYPLDWIGRGESGRFAEIFPQVGLQTADELHAKESRRVRCTGSCGPFGTLHVTERVEQFFIKIDVLLPNCRENYPGCARIADSKELDRELRAAGAKVGHATDFIAGKQVDRVETSFPGEPKLVRRGEARIAPHYWCAGCRMRELIVPWTGGRTLYIRVMSSDPDDFERFNALINFTLENIRPYRAPGS